MRTKIIILIVAFFLFSLSSEAPCAFGQLNGGCGIRCTTNQTCCKKSENNTKYGRCCRAQQKKCPSDPNWVRALESSGLECQVKTTGDGTCNYQKSDTKYCPFRCRGLQGNSFRPAGKNGGCPGGFDCRPSQPGEDNCKNKYTCCANKCNGIDGKTNHKDSLDGCPNQFKCVVKDIKGQVCTKSYSCELDDVSDSERENTVNK